MDEIACVRRIARLAGTMGLGLAMGLFAIHCQGDSEDWKKADRIVPLEEYSREEAREWEDIKEDHIPKVRRSIDKGEGAVLIEVDLKTDTSHYIEKFGVMTMEREEIYSVSIERTNRPFNYAYIPLSELPHFGKYKFFAKCNQHDLWVTVSSIPQQN